jgi:hypothetical protein
VLNLRLFCTSFYTDVVILICHLLPIRLYLIRQSNGAVIERVLTQIDSDVLTEPQAEAFICASTGSFFSKFNLLV